MYCTTTRIHIDASVTEPVAAHRARMKTFVWVAQCPVSRYQVPSHARHESRRARSGRPSLSGLSDSVPTGTSAAALAESENRQAAGKACHARAELRTGGVAHPAQWIGTYSFDLSAPPPADCKLRPPTSVGSKKSPTTGSLLLSVAASRFPA